MNESTFEPGANSNGNDNEPHAQTKQSKKSYGQMKRTVLLPSKSVQQRSSQSM